MTPAFPPFGIVVPIRNEAATLRETLPALVQSIGQLPARPVWVCNECSDDSAEVIREFAGQDAEILILPHAGKSTALQAGDDALERLFPRFYLDADVKLSPGALPALLHLLLSGQADLVAARRSHETSGVTALSAAMARTWDALPYAQEMGFLGAIGVSSAGRACWGRWPIVMGDDLFVTASIAPDRRQIVTHVTGTTRPPADFVGWVRMRARWRQGEAELRAMGLIAAKPPGQRRALLRQMVTPRLALGAWAFAAARLLAPLVHTTPASGWQPDRRTFR